MFRFAAAFLASALPGALIQAIIVAAWPKPGKGIFAHPASMFVAACLAIYVFEILFGAPALLLLRRAGRGDLRSHALAGLGAILIPVLLALVWSSRVTRMSLYVWLYDLTYSSVAGLLAGMVFWCIARPDRRSLRKLEAIF
jgi:uncharacterized membrane protein